MIVFLEKRIAIIIIANFVECSLCAMHCATYFFNPQSDTMVYVCYRVGMSTLRLKRVKKSAQGTSGRVRNLTQAD